MCVCVQKVRGSNQAEVIGVSPADFKSRGAQPPYFFARHNFALFGIEALAGGPEPERAGVRQAGGSSGPCVLQGGFINSS